MKIQNILIGFVGVACTLVLTSTSVHAQTYQPPQPVLQRHGFLIGFSVGAGTMLADCEDCESLNGIGADFHVGGMIAPRLGLMLDTSLVSHPDEGVTFSNIVNAIAAQYWVSPRA